MKSKQIMLIAVALGCGLLSAIGIIQAMGNKADAAPKIPMGPVVVAISHLDHKDKLNDENVKLENWPVNLIPEGASTDLAEVRGKVITTRLSKGQAIIQQTVFAKEEVPGLAIPPGHKVINIKVPPEDAMPGLMHPGDRVDIIGVFRIRDKKGQSTSETMTFLKGIRVFNIGSTVSAHASKKDGAGSSGIVGVLVTERQSEKIVHARKNGEIRLALIGEQDADTEFEDPEGPLFPWQEKEGEELDIAASDMERGTNFDMLNARKMVIFAGSTGATTTFFDTEGNVVDQQIDGSIGPGQIPRNRGGSSTRPPSDPVDYEKSDDSEELDEGMEEDQYHGE